MKKNEVLGNITLDETDIQSLKTIEDGFDTIILENNTGEDVDGTELAEYFSRVRGIERVTTLRISRDSSLKDLMVVIGFPNLNYIFVRGFNIKSLDGLEYLTRILYLEIDTGKYRSRSIANISRAPISRMELVYARKEDFDAIASSRTINILELAFCPHPPFNKWGKVPFEKLKISGGRFTEFGDTAYVEKLYDIFLIDCRKLERFVGDNSRITRMLIVSCSRLDVNTIKAFSNLELLTINNRPNYELPLSAFSGLKKLKELELLRCKVKLDIMDLKEVLPSLEKIYIGGLKKEQINELLRRNPGLRFEFN